MWSKSHRLSGLAVGLAGLSCPLIGQTPEASAPVFVDRSVELGCTPVGEWASFGDIDGDGWPDLWAGGAVWWNRGGLRFVRLDAPGSGLIVDLDNDGVGDLVSIAPLALYRGVHQGDTLRFVPGPSLPVLPPAASRGAAAGDFDGDGFVDLYVGGYEDSARQLTHPSFLLRNERGERLVLAATSSERRARGVTACDFDEDGDLDVYVSNYRLQPNSLLVNDGLGQLSDRADELNARATSPGFPGGHSIGACFGDFDGDGRFDLFAGNFAHVDSRGDQPKSRLLQSLGAGRPFEDLGEQGVHYQESYASPACADYDNDGRLDLYLTTVYATASFGKKNFPVLYRNQATSAGAWTFRDVTDGSGVAKLPPTYQAAWADVDRDGRIDLVTAGRMFMNVSAQAHWLELRLVGDGRRVNRGALGAQARVSLPDGRTLTRQVEAGTGEGNSNSPILHFGLGTFAGPAQVTIRWPDGTTRTLDDVAVDRVIEVDYLRSAR